MTDANEKRAYWDQQIGKKVAAQNYRGETVSACLLRVVSGVWGYGGDSVALVLDAKDSHGLEFWPAGLCSVDE